MVKEGWSCGVLSGPESFCTVQFWELSACLDRHLVPRLIKISLLLERKRGASAKGLGGVAWWRLGPPAGECASIWDPGRESREVKTCEVKVAQSWLTLCDPVGYIVHGILQARILEWVAFSRGSFQHRDRTQVSRIAGGFFTT